MDDKRPKGRSTQYVIPLTMRPHIDYCMKQIGADPKRCYQCNAYVPNGCQLHHTRYEGATIYDLEYVCQRCNTQPENRYLS